MPGEQHRRDEAITATLFVVALVCFAFPMAFPSLAFFWRVAFALVCLVLGSGVLLLGIFPRFNPPQRIRVVAALAWAAVIGYGIIGIVRDHVQASALTATRPSPIPTVAEMPLMTHWPPEVGRDERGRLFAKIGIYDTTGAPESYSPYGKIELGPAVDTVAARSKVLTPIRDRVHELAAAAFGDARYLYPHAPYHIVGSNKPFDVPDDYVTIVGSKLSNRDWSTLQKGQSYAYLYVVFLTNFGQSHTSTSFRYCAVASARHPEPDHCPNEFEETPHQ